MRSNYNHKNNTFVKPKVQEEIRTNNAIMYLRVSSKWQEKYWHWLDSQLDWNQVAVQWRNMNLVKVFDDKAISWKIIDRPWIREMLEFCKLRKKKWTKYQIEILVVSEISRITRPEFIDVWFDVCRKFRELWVDIYEASTNTLYERWDDWKLLQLHIRFMNAKSELESITIRKKNWIINRLKNWYYPFSHPPAWYIHEHIELEGWNRNIIQVKHPIMGDILQSALVKYSTWELYNAVEFIQFLNDHKFKWNCPNKKHHSSSRRKLGRTYFDRIMKPRKLYYYAWLIVYPKYWLIEPVAWIQEALITVEQLHQIIKRLADKNKARPYRSKSKSSDLYRLKSVLKCKWCKSTMHWSACVWKMKKVYHYYECKNSDCVLKIKKIRWSCPIKDVHSSVEKILEQLQSNDRLWKVLSILATEAIENSWNSKIQKEKALLEHLKKLEEKEVAIQNWIIENAKNIDAVNLMTNALSKIKKEISELHESMAELKETDKSFELLEGIKKIIDNPLSIRCFWDNQTKFLLMKLLFWWNLYYQKNQGLRTPDFIFPMRDLIDSKTQKWEIWVTWDSNPGPWA